MTPEATKSAASFPRSAATRSWRRLMVGSSTYTSSPTSASAMARRMPAEGRVTVSLRRSMGASLVGTATLLLTKTTGLADLRRGRATSWALSAYHPARRRRRAPADTSAPRSPLAVALAGLAVLQRMDAARTHQVGDAGRGLEGARPLVGLLKEVPGGEESVAAQHAELVVDEGGADGVGHLVGAHGALHRHHRHAVQQVGALGIDGDDLILLQRKGDAVRGMRVEDGLGGGAQVDGTVHHDLAGGQGYAAVIPVYAGLDEIFGAETSQHRSPTGDHETVAHPHRHVAGVRAHKAGQEAVAAYVTELLVDGGLLRKDGCLRTLCRCGRPPGPVRPRR